MSAGFPLSFGPFGRYMPGAPDMSSDNAQQPAIHPDIAALLSRAPMGAPQSFAGTSGTIVPSDAPEDLQAQMVPLPPARPSDAALATPLSFGPLPGTRRASTPAVAAEPASASAQAATAAPAATTAPATTGSVAQPAEGPSIFDKIGDGLRTLNANGGGDLLTSIGMGLLSTPGLARGVAAGLQNDQAQQAKRAATGLAQAEMDLKRQKLAREQQGQNQTAQIIANKLGIPMDQALGFATNSSFVNNFLQNNYGTPAGWIKGADGRLMPIPGGENDPATIEARARAAAAGAAAGKPDDPKLVDVPQADGSVRKVWLKPGETEGSAVGATSAPAPQVRTFTNPDGSKRDLAFDPASRQWVEPAAPAVPATVGNPYATGAFNDTQGKAAGFSDRMLGSEQTLRKYEGINKDAISGTIGAMLPNTMKSEDRQAYEQAKRSFINAQLRRESGAAIAPSEFDSAERQYFPQPGESPALIEQKRLERQRAIEAMAREGGPAYRPSHVFGEDGSLVPFGTKQNQGMASPKTQADFDALPKGAIYIDPQDGKKYRK